MKFPILAAACLVLAGCSGSAGNDAAPSDSFDVPVEATSTTGVIRGVVVDQSIRPVAGATITIPVGADMLTEQTNEDGAFGFDGLTPGTYFVTATKASYNTIQQSVDVVAGISDPTPLRFGLVQDVSKIPYFVPEEWDGYIECSGRVATGPTGILSLGVNACNEPVPLGQDVNRPVTLQPNETFIQGEMYWESTQNLGSGLSFVVGPQSCADVKYARADGNSPLVIRLNRTQLEDHEALDGVCYRAFSYVAEESLGFVGLVIEQRFQVVFHHFFNFVPPLDWQFTVDGDPPIPK